ncbi:HI1450 family dsDNA-mimic protein [Pseudoalteromonas sp. SSDWG2]|uniref:HI1450 family dsDNA-mimic protein n=1 Tax=Pseudoalteromonas sp. SSDWG2 TaxID=3139391 RepID=UPI003BAD5803
MSGPRLLTEEEITHQAYEVFLELAPEHLSEQDIDDFNAHREALGFIEESAPSEQWHEIVAMEIEPEFYSEVTIGLELENQDLVFARVLISRDQDAPFCHIIWKE